MYQGNGSSQASLEKFLSEHIMPFQKDYLEDAPSREQIEAQPGLLLLEFGAQWCPHCQAISSTLEELLNRHPEVTHVRIADGKGKRLGRTFGVKIWPNLVYLADGQPVAQQARPDREEIEKLFLDFVVRDRKSPPD